MQFDVVIGVTTGNTRVIGPQGGAIMVFVFDVTRPFLGDQGTLPFAANYITSADGSTLPLVFYRNVVLACGR